MRDIEIKLYESDQSSPENLGSTLAGHIGNLVSLLWPGDAEGDKAYAVVSASIVRAMITSKLVSETDAWETLIETFNDNIRGIDPWPEMQLRIKDVDPTRS